MSPALSTEARIDEFLARFTPEIEAALRDARARLRGRFTHGHELVFDNYNALVFGISPTTSAAASFISVVGYPKWVTLFFLRGTGLDDPQGLLEGSGSTVRGIRLRTPAEMDQPPVQALIAQAVRPVAEALRAAPPLATTIKMVALKQRPRRPPAKAAARKP